MNVLSRFLTCAVLGAGVAMAAAANASAASIYWSHGGWHLREKHRHPVKPVVVFYANDWRWGRTDDYYWRLEHGFPGYLRGNKLIWVDWP